MNYEALTQAIEESEIITVFRHEHPDCDALGSQWGLVTWLKDNYPSKQIYALGKEKTDQAEFPESNVITDDVIKKSLAVVLDTGNVERIDDDRSPMAAKVIKIDHHPNVEPFGSLIFVKTDAAATCEILAEYFQTISNAVFSKKTAEYLYKGLLTDTLCYATSNTTPHTLEMGAYIASKGVNIPAVNRELFDQDEKAFTFASFVRSKIQTIGGKVAYVIISLEDQEKMQISASSARNFITEMGHVKEFEAWCMFTEKIVDGKHLYDGSLRSKTVILNDLAREYSGGGHPNASGVKNLDEKMIKTLLQSIFLRV
jgi:acetate kinase/phosphoesterase RecJ-like protein